MSKKKKHKIKKLTKNEIPSAVRFELEDDAEAIFKEYLENSPPNLLTTSYEDGDFNDKLIEEKKIINTQNRFAIDLHGFTLDQAIFQVDKKIRDLLITGPRIFMLTVITGKGRHSGIEGGVLAREIHNYIRQTFAKNLLNIEESPADLMIDGLPIRGHFLATFRKNF